MSFPTNKTLEHVPFPTGGWPIGSEGAKDAINRVRIHTKAVPMSVVKPFAAGPVPKTKAGLDRIREMAKGSKSE